MISNEGPGFGPISFYGDLKLEFIDGVLINIASLFALVFGSQQVYKFLTTPHPRLKYRRDWLLVSRILSVVLFFLFTVVAGFSSGYAGNFHWMARLQYFMTGCAVLVLFALHWVSFLWSRISNGVLLFFWLLETTFLSMKVVNFIIRHTYEGYWPMGKITFVLTLFQLVASTSVLALEAIPRKRLLPYQEIIEYQNKRKSSPVNDANIFERISFSWMTGLMRIGYEKYLTENDLYRLPEEYRSKETSDRFTKNWQAEMNRKTNPSLAWALIRTFGGQMVIGGIYKAIHDVAAFTQPQLLRIIVRFVTDYSTAKGEAVEQYPLSRGFMIALAMFTVSVVQTCVLHQYFSASFTTGMNIKGALTTVIYQKALVLSNESSKTSKTGDIVNLMSVDVQRLQDLTQWGQLLWSGPFQIGLCLVSLYKLLGNSMWVGVLVMLIMIPLNSIIFRYQKKLQKAQMKNKDERTRIVSEILNNIKSLKLYAWEIPYKQRLDYVRNEKELKNLRKMGITSAFASFQYKIVPFLVSCSTFAVFVFTQKNRGLTTDLVFPALSLFMLLNFPLAVLPMAITSFVEASVSVGRLHAFLTSEEIQRDSVQRSAEADKFGDLAVSLSDEATFLWQRKPEYKVALKNINLHLRKGELCCVVGKVGSGKSALMQAMLGDLFRVKGSVVVNGSVAYISQVAWIMNGTVKENILFGHKYDHEFYERTIRACALSTDLGTLPDGDQTLVGEKGISLSGGQRARLSLARAVYARADVYLLDDPLAAVDEHVSKHLVTHVLGPDGLLKNKTRVLTTNKIAVLTVSDSITLLDNGEIVQQGSFDQINNSEIDSPLYKLISEYGKKKEVEEIPETEPDITVTTHPNLSPEEEMDAEDLNSKNLSASSDTVSLRRASFATFKSMNFSDSDGKKDQKEHREEGKVKWDIYLEYAKACNPKHVVILIGFVILSMLLSVLSNVWLKHWSEVNTEHGFNPNPVRYLAVYFSFGFSSALSTLAQNIILWVYCSIHGSRYLHNAMATAILAVPMSFFEITPIGRILNRFSNDIYKVDELLGRTFSQFFVNVTNVLFTLLIICFTSWQMTFVIMPLGIVYFYYQQYFLRTSRELRRLDSLTRSPIYAHFQETLNGVSTVRAYAQQDRFVHLNQSFVDKNLSAYYPSSFANRWLAFRLEFISSAIILAAASLSMFRLKQGTLTAGMIGLSLGYALQITQSLNWIVRMSVEVETNIVAVERIKEYAILPSEAPAIIPDSRPPKDWPTQGEIKFENYSTRYRPELGLVLKDINLHIRPREKIGIVGRTGAGKSSLTLALFRIIEAAKGRIIIDDLPIDTIGLADLRHSLSIIPQDAQLFEGTIRDNIDPTNQFTEEQIWEALELSHLKTHVENMGPGGLQSALTEGGANLSVGQRQLMCLARAILVPSKILVLDEATAAVDAETDKLIQETIRSTFKDRTILTIAHRVNTILDSDRIIVLDNGRVVEFDTPHALLKAKESIFYSLCNEAGLTL
ncbi:HBR056Cp [Eremothecium sinecaudum]|uniref:HBR056Cp n=1 Tax=Eremothecium sinecaudum TaxID=45286 RepID=A0A109UX64_9SACH|nr:HBR056Cp [Eremothecium sinecaudum]AMD18957.1 HBR056Cp [Eremothecium sinecaudum]